MKFFCQWVAREDETPQNPRKAKAENRSKGFILVWFSLLDFPTKSHTRIKIAKGSWQKKPSLKWTFRDRFSESAFGDTHTILERNLSKRDVLHLNMHSASWHAAYSRDIVMCVTFAKIPKRVHGHTNNDISWRNKHAKTPHAGVIVSPASAHAIRSFTPSALPYPWDVVSIVMFALFRLWNFIYSLSKEHNSTLFGDRHTILEDSLSKWVVLYQLVPFIPSLKRRFESIFLKLKLVLVHRTYSKIFAWSFARSAALDTCGSSLSLSSRFLLSLLCSRACSISFLSFSVCEYGPVSVDNLRIYKHVCIHIYIYIHIYIHA